MTTNKYFKNRGQTNEQNIIHDLNIEAIQIKGIDVKYIPRKMVKEDKLFGEDVLSSFVKAYDIEMFISSVDGFGGEGDLMASFGLSIKDELNLEVSTRRFLKVTSMTKPLEGDLIYFPDSKGLFELKFVEDEEPFYPLGTLPTFKLRCELFDYSHETFTTGVPDIDDIIDLETTDTFGDNDDIETEADSILDDSFDNQNPFGSA